MEHKGALSPKEDEPPPKPQTSPGLGSDGDVLTNSPQKATSSQAPASKPQMNFWCEAYIQCCRRDDTKDLIRDLKILLWPEAQSANTGNADTADGSVKSDVDLKAEFETFSTSLAPKLKAKAEELEQRKWTISVLKRNVSVQDSVKKFVHLMAGVKDFVGAAVASSPQAQLAWATVCFGLQFLENPIKGHESLIDTYEKTTRLIQRYTVVERTYSLTDDKDEGLESAVTSLYTAILVFQATAFRHLVRPMARRVLSNTFKPQRWENLCEDIDQSESECDKLLEHLDQEFVRIELTKQSRNIEDIKTILMSQFKQQLDELKEDQSLASLESNSVISAALNSGADSRALCLPETRVTLRAELVDWSQSDDPDTKDIFWVSGMAGTGKSTIARTVAADFIDQGHLVASFSFSRNEADRSDTTKLVNTFALQLAYASAAARSGICEALRLNRAIVSGNLEDQWDSLIKQPLEKMFSQTDSMQVCPGVSAQPQTVILVVDALDECNKDTDIKAFFQTIQRYETKSARFRILITSRAPLIILMGVRRLGAVVKTRDLSESLPEFRGEVEGDLRKYYLNRLNQAKQEYLERRNMELELWEGQLDPEAWPELDGWPKEADITRLVERADGLFQYAKLACDLVQGQDGTPAERLEEVLDVEQGKGLDDLDQIYLKTLQFSIPVSKADGRRFLERFPEIVGAIILSVDLPSSHSISRLLQRKFNDLAVNDIVARLYSVLQISKTAAGPVINVIHSSFREFLIDEKRCVNEQFHVDEKKTHEQLFRGCVEVLKGLSEDLCSLKNPGTRIVEMRATTDEDEVVERSDILKKIELEVQYACRFWIHHLVHVGYKKELLKLALDFLEEHFLHWLEALSLIGRTPDGVLAISSLETYIQNEKNPDLHAFIYDAKRFALYNRPAIEHTPLQIYASALVFTPEKSIIREKFRKQVPSWIKSLHVMPLTWSATPQILECHTGEIKALSFSPDGRLVATGSSDGTAKLWATATGARVETLKGHSGSIVAVAFSPEGTLLVTGSEDGTIMRWEATQGTWPQKPETCEVSVRSVRVMVFSPDCKLVAIGSGDRMFASADGTVKLFDTATGFLLQTLDTLDGHYGPINGVAFSPDGKSVATSSGNHHSHHFSGIRDSTVNGTVKLWDVATGARVRTLEGDFGRTPALAFSPDGQVVATGSCDTINTRFHGRGNDAVMLWDATTGTRLQELKSRVGQARVVAFSPDGELIATVAISESGVSTVRLWDTSGTLLVTLEGYSGRGGAGASDETIESHHSSWVRVVAFSPDSKLVAIGSSDGTLKLWDTMSARLQKPEALEALEGHSGPVTAVTFSPDGKLVVTGAGDGTIQLWAATGARLQRLEGHSRRVRVVMFSPDGKQVLTGSGDGFLFSDWGSIMLWDLASEARLQELKTLEDHSSCVRAVAFSPNSKLVATGSRSGSVRLWNATTADLLQTLKPLDGSFSRVSTVAFSPESDLVAAGCETHSGDGTVQLWDSATGAHQQTLQRLENRFDHICAMAFSPDGTLAATGGSECKVRLWKPAEGARSRTLETLERHNGLFTAMAFSPNGKLVAAGSGDRKVRLWDTATGAHLETTPVTDKEFKSLSFSKSGPYLETDRGLFKIQSTYTDTFPLQAEPVCDVFVEKSWVTRDMKNLLWLPPNYRATCSALQGNTLVVGHASGQVTFITFSL